MTFVRKIRRNQLLRAGLIALQWSLLTVALGAVVVYSSDAFEGYITPKLESGFIFFGAFVFAFLLGISIESFKVLMPLAVLMCAGASIVFVMVVFSPTYAEVTIRTTQLENYATTRAFLFTVLMFLPAVVGAGFGNLATRKQTIWRPRNHGTSAAIKRPRRLTPIPNPEPPIPG
jgi:hypothetical protein